MNEGVNKGTWTAGSKRKTLEGYEAYYPNPLPLTIDYPESIVPVLTDATAAVHRLAGASRLLPTPEILIGPYVRIEAILSSRIEGTQATVGQLLEFEGAGLNVEPRGDLEEVLNYVRALNYAVERLSDLPLSSRLIRETHAILMEGVRGERATPGEYRKSQNWIGPPGATLEKASFVPPPHDALGDAIKEFEIFLQDRSLPNLIAIGLAHYQFETIHPFLDGNGRIGRLLIILMMIERQILSEPVLYLSAYFEEHRDDYYELLDATRRTSDVFPWLEFFLNGVTRMARAAEDRALRLTDLQRQLRNRLLEGGGTQTAVRLSERLLDLPYVTASRISNQLDVSFPTAQRAIDDLVEIGILEEVTGQKRNRVYLSQEIMDIVYGDVENI